MVKNMTEVETSAAKPQLTRDQLESRIAGQTKSIKDWHKRYANLQKRLDLVERMRCDAVTATSDLKIQIIEYRKASDERLGKQRLMIDESAEKAKALTKENKKIMNELMEIKRNKTECW